MAVLCGYILEFVPSLLLRSFLHACRLENQMLLAIFVEDDDNCRLDMDVEKFGQNRKPQKCQICLHQPQLIHVDGR